MEVIIGTYEEFLIGYTLKLKNDELVLEQSFTNHAHRGSIRSIATSSKHLASGSIDEVIHLINIKHRVEVGTLASHTGTITSLQFLRTSYLFSSSEDGCICIWNTKNWQCEKILRGHTDAILSIDLHTSGKLLLSVSKDKTLRTWNLIKGRCAYIVNLKKIAHQVLWSPTGIYFGLVFENDIDIYDVSTGGILYTINEIQSNSNINKRINKILFIDDQNIIICGDFNDLIMFNLESKTIVNKFEAHNNRIKDMDWVNLNTIGENLIKTKTDNIKWLVTISSDGFIKIWSCCLLDLKSKFKLVTEIDTTCRPTCLSIWGSEGNQDEKFSSFVIPELKVSGEYEKSRSTKKKRINKDGSKLESKKQKIPIKDD